MGRPKPSLERSMTAPTLSGSTWRDSSRQLGSVLNKDNSSNSRNDDDSLYLPAPVTQPARNSPPPSVLGHGAGSTRARRRAFAAWRSLSSLWRGGTDQTGLDQASIRQSEALRLDTVASSDTDATVADEVDEVVVNRLWKAPEVDKDGRASLFDEPASVASVRKRPGDDERQMRARDSWPRWPWWLFRWKLYPRIQNFYQPLFDPVTEAEFREEQWKVGRPLAGISAIFYITNWILSTILLPGPIVLGDKIWFYGVAPLVSVPLLLLIVIDLPRQRPVLYQTLIAFSCWGWSIYHLLSMYFCGHYDDKEKAGFRDCAQRDFIELFYYASCLPTIGLFGLKLNRLTTTLGAITFIVLASVLVVPFEKTWIRNVLNFFMFNAFLLYAHYVTEQTQRRLFILRVRLASQFDRTRQAQLNERSQFDSKRRLTSYVFHEVRVPLNTALLAAQNIEAELGALLGPKGRSDQRVEFAALAGSLNQMSAVLNDILDFNRMESGRFTILSRPFALHAAMRSLFVPLRLAAEARKLRFVTELDEEIDHLAKRAAYRSMGKNEESIRLYTEEDSSGIVVGDEMRLRQIVTNLASNACKFTPPGGEVRITTRLLDESPPPPSPDEEEMEEKVLSAKYLASHNSAHDERMIVRIEVTDTGSGIPRKDMIENKLFSSFSQTEQGRLQGGKGTGLGLSIVCQIVRLSGGRLGVRSKVGHGTTFFVDLPLGIGKKAVEDGTTPSLSLQSDNSMSKPVTTRPPGSRPGSGAMEASDPYNRPQLRGEYNSFQLLSLARQDYTAPATIPEDEAPTPMIAPAPAPAIGPPTPPEFVETPPPLRVLVVDDDNLTRVLMRKMLTRLGHTVDAVENGRLALDAMTMGAPVPLPTPASVSDGSERRSYGLEAGPPPPRTPGRTRYDIVFMDNQMPVMSGLEAMRELRKSGGVDFVVGVTGNALSSDVEEFLEAGADHVLTKPVYQRDLEKMLNLARKRRNTPDFIDEREFLADEDEDSPGK